MTKKELSDLVMEISEKVFEINDKLLEQELQRIANNDRLQGHEKMNDTIQTRIAYAEKNSIDVMIATLARVLECED